MSSRMRSTKSKRNMRRSHHKISLPSVFVDKDGQSSLRHHTTIQKKIKKVVKEKVEDKKTEVVESSKPTVAIKS